MTPFKGNAAFTWTDSTATPPDRAYLLNRPLDRVQYAVRQTTYTQDSLDLTVRQTYTIGTGVYEIVAQIRYDDDPADLIDLIRYGQRGGTITYWPDLTNDAESYACYLIDPLGAAPLELESSYPAVGSLVTVRLRQTTGVRFP